MAGESPRRVVGSHELSSSAVWLTNLEFDTFYRDLRKNGSNLYRHDTFLRTSLWQLACELGLNDIKQYKRLTGREEAQVMSRFFGDVMEASWRLGIRGYPQMMLSKGYRDRFYPDPPDVEYPRDLKDAFADINKAYSFSERRVASRKSGAPDVSVSFTRHRYQHAVQVCEQPIPYGDWRRVSMMSRYEIRDTSIPLLLRVVVNRVDAHLGALVNFGGYRNKLHVDAGVAQRDASPRQWMSLPEYVFMSQHADIEVHEIYQAGAYIENPTLAALDRIDLMQQLSPAFLLCCENLWTCPQRAKMDFLTDKTAVAGWLRSYDRLLCLRDALTLIERDPEVDVVSMSFGRILVKVPDKGPALGSWLLHMIRGTDLLPPLCVAAPATMAVSDEPSPVEVLQAANLAGDRGLLSTLDESAFYDWDHEQAAA